ncbi:retention module-containing protein [Pseudomonas sp. CC6-YY-74]|uniref:retention module-containing protein n=1 Tax=Pseudomonas sp. CC6-YY-74 TaxID=1930532 RepID=UPI0009A1964A|nr:retention module-containing protein [Pseudomonas sp. CC6-YY-74]
MSNFVAVIKSLVGQVFVVSLDGLKRQVFEGERLFQGDQVVTASGGSATLELANGDVIDIAANGNWQAGGDQASEQVQAAQAPASELEQAIAAGFDPTADLEPTAAGPGAAGGAGGAAGGGHSFVMLDETGQQLDPTVGFETEGLGVAASSPTEEEAPEPIEALEIANTAPVALADSFTVNEDGSISIDVLSNDTDLDGDSLTITAVDGQTIAEGGSVNVSNGSVTLINGQLVFNPTANYSGPVSFSYTVSDGVLTSTAMVSGTVDPINDAPVANDDSLTASEDTPVTFTAAQLTGNDTDPENSPLTINSVTSGTGGTAVLNSDGTVTFTPNANFNGTADFTYTVTDGELTSNVATATVTVGAINDAPVANDDSLTASEDTPVTFTAAQLTGNDTDPENSPLTINSVTSGTGGTAVLNSDGTVTFTPNANFNGAADFTYTVTDGELTSNVATATVTVTPINDAPIAASSSISVAEESTGTSLGLTAPTDVDGDSLTITVSGLPTLGTVTKADGSAISNGDTLTSAELTGLLYNAPADYTSGDAVGSFSYSVNDGTVTVSGTTTIGVTPINDAPIAASSSISVAEESTGTSLGLTAPTDVDGDSLTITVSGLPTLGTVTKADGSAISNGDTLTSAELTGLLYNAPADYTSGDAVGSFSYSVNDGTVTVSGTTTIGVTPINDAPIAASSSISVAEESTGTSLGLTAPTDVDGDSLTITVSGLPTLGTVTKADGSAISNGDTLTSAELTGLLYNAPADYTSGDAVGSFSYSVNDGTVTVSGTTTIGVTPINDAPIAASSSISVAEESTGTSLGLTAPTDVDGDSLTITVSGLPTLGTVTKADGSAISNGDTLTSAELTGLLYNAPADYTSGDAVGSFSYSVNDGTVTVSGTTTIGVTPINDAPIAASSSISVAEESTGTSLGLTAPTDVDGDSLTITVSGLPTLGTVTKADGSAISNGDTLTSAELTGLLYNAPADYTSGDAVGSFSYSVNDGTVTVSGTTTIGVTPINDAPIAASSSISVAEESTGTSLGLTAPTDVDGDSLTITVSGLPTLGTVTKADGSAISNGDTLTSAELTGLLYNAPADYTSGDAVGSFSYSVNDGTVTVSGTTTIGVTPINDAPIAASSSISVAEESTGTSLGLTAPTDVDGDSLTITVSGLPTLGTVTKADGSAISNGDTLTSAELTGLLYNAPADYTSGDAVGSFSYSVNDGTVTVSGTTTIGVTPINDAPIAASSSISVAEESTGTSLGLTAPTDVDGDSLTITVSGLPTLGTVTKADGSAISNGDTLTSAELTGLLYNAPADYTSGDAVGSFSYSVNDGTVTASGTTTIGVTPINDAPIAASSSISVAEESTGTSLGLTAPTDVDGDSLTITVSGLPTLGTVTKADGSAISNGDTLTSAELTGLLYNAPADYTSGDAVGSFSYSVNDGTVTVSGTTTIGVTPINDAPIAASSSISVAEESTGTSLGLTAPTDVDGDSLTITVSGLPTLGTVTKADGSAISNGDTLTSAELTGLLYNAPADYTSGDAVGSFSYSVNDGTVTVSGTTTIGVTPINDAPIAASSSISVAEESTGTSLGLTAPTDVDGDSLTITVSGLPTLGTVTKADGSAISNGDTLTSAELTGLLYNAPADYTSGDAVGSFSYSVNDGTVTVSGTTTIGVTPINDAPIAASSSISVAEESTGTSLGLTAPTDVDGDSLTITVSGLPTLGTVTKADGSAISNGDTLTSAELTGLLYNAPADYTSGDAVGSFSYSVNDGTVTVSGTTTIGVTPINDAPIAASSSISVAEESTGTSLGLTAPTDVDGDSLTITVSGLPTLGTVTKADGSAISNGDTLTSAELTGLLYNAPADYTSGDAVGSFSYSVNDGTVTVSGTTTIGVTPINDAPIAASSSISVAEESTGTSLGLTAPTDVDGDSLTITVSGLPTLGTVTKADGSAISNGDTLTSAELTGLLYNAPADYTSGDAVGSFSYSVNDGTVTVSGTTTIGVTPINDAPIAASSSISVAEESTGTSLGLTAPTDVDGDSLTITVSGLPTLGTVTKADGSAISNGDTLTSAELTGLLYNAPADYTSGDAVGSFSYSVNDGTVTVSGTTTIGVTPINDAPIAASSSISVAEESTGTSLGLTAPTDVDGDSLTITVSGLPTLGTVTKADGSAISNGDTLTSAELTGLLYNAPADYTSGDAVGSFSYSVNDGTVTVSGTTTIGVTPINDAPIAASSSISVAEESTGTSLGLTAPTDVDGDSLTITVSGLPTLGTVTKADGSAISNGDTLTSAELTGLLYNAPADYTSGDAVGSFSYSVNDGTVTVSGTTTIGVTPINDAPIAASSSISVAEESTGTSLGLTAPTDVDGDSLTITVSGLPTLGTVTKADGSAISNGDTLTSAELTGLLYNAPADYTSGDAVGSFSYSVNDGTVTVSGTTTIGVTPINDAPIAASSSISVAEESTGTSLGLTAPTDVDGDSLTITVSGLPTLGTVTKADGSAISNGDTLTSAELTGLLYNAPADYTSGDAVGSFSYSVNDGTVTVSGTTTIGVTPINDAPIAASSSISVAEESTGTSLGLTAPTDVDGDSLTITVSGLPTLGTVTKADGSAISNGDTLTSAELTGLLYNAPADYTSGDAVGSFSYSVNDGTVTVSGTTTIGVTPINDAPIAASSSISVAEESTGTSLGLTAPTDVDGDSLTITVSGLPTLGTVTKADGSAISNGDTLTSAELTGLLYNAPADYTSGDAVGSFSYSVNDGTVTVSGTTTIGVTPINDAPIAASSSISVAEESTGTSLGLTAPTDVDGDSLTITVSGLPTLGTVTKADGSAISNGDTLTSAELTGLLYNAPADYTSGDAVGSFSYSVNDGTVTVSGTTTIGVTPINDAPIAASSSISVAEESTGTSLGLTAPTDVDGDSLTITVSGLPTLGTVTKADGSAISNGDTLTSAELTGLLYNAPADYTSGDAVGSFSYSVNDGTVTVSGTTTIGVTPVNDAPTGTDGVITLNEDTSYSFSADDFGFSDADIGDSLQAVRIDSLLSAGSLQLNGTSVTSGQVITLAQLNNLTFTPAHDASGNGYTNLSFSVSDQSGQFATTPNTLTFDVTPVADAPIVTIAIGASNISTTTINTANAASSGQGFTVQAFNLDGTAGVISSNSSPIGFGVVGAASGANNELGYSNGQSERLVVTFDAPVASATVSFAWLHTGERATYNLFDSAGNPIGSNTLAGITDSIDPAITLTSSTGAAISRIEFSAPGAGDDYLINSIEFATSTSYPLTITATPTDIDYSESIASITVAVPAGATLSAGSANGDGTWTLPLTSSGSYSVVVDPATQAVSIRGLSMTLPGNPVGSLSVTVTATAQDGADTESNAATITIGDATAPETGDVSVVANEDSGPITITLNATDAASSIANFTITSLPANGTLMYNSQAVQIGQAIPAVGNQANLSFIPGSNWNGSTDFQYRASDVAGNVDQTPATVSILINPVNDAPVNQLPASYTTNEDTALKLSGLSVSDVDVASGLITVTLAVARGSLSAAAASGVNVSGAGTGILVLSGTLADINTYLASPATQPSYIPLKDDSGSVTLSMTSNDGGNTGAGGVLTDTDSSLITINPVADAIPGSDVSIVIGTPVVNEISFTSDGGLTGKSEYTFGNGVTISTGSNATFNWSGGNNLGVNSPGDNGTQAQRIDGSEAINFRFPTGMQYMALRLKNSADDVFKISSKLETADLVGQSTLSGAITTSSTSVVSSANLKVDLQLEVVNAGVTSTVTRTATVTAGGSWSVSLTGISGTITKATLNATLDGGMFNQGGNESANVTYSISADMSSLAIGLGAANTFGTNAKNNGFQIEYIATDPNPTGLTSYSYPLDVYAVVQDKVGTPETITSFTLSDLPAGSSINVVLADGSYQEINANAQGVYDLSPYTSLLSTSTAISGTDKIYLVTSSALPTGFAPTLSLEITDGASVAKTIIGGSANSTFVGGSGNDYISGGAGQDTLIGGAGNDTLDGGTGNDILIGGTGDDILLGGTGADSFVWKAGDTGRDVIKDFKASEGDRIDLHDLLQGENDGNILNYLRVNTTTSTLEISSTGQFASGGSADATIKLEHAGAAVDLSGYGSTSSQIVNSLIAGADPIVKIDHT